MDTEKLISFLKSTEFPEDMMEISEKKDFDKFRNELKKNISNWAELFKKLPVVVNVYTLEDLKKTPSACFLQIRVRNTVKSFLNGDDTNTSEFFFIDNLYQMSGYDNLRVVSDRDFDGWHADIFFDRWIRVAFPSPSTRMELKVFFLELCKLERIYKNVVPEIESA